jgi:diaminohydroxyphosphoribosylaminopyrimidine deaminase/5-amino-6-(5-phosphoribosylamino)uracil reductase
VILTSGKQALPDDCRLLHTIDQAPVLVFTSQSQVEKLSAWSQRGCEIVGLAQSVDGNLSIAEVLGELGRRRMTNVLVEGGAGVLGAFLDDRLMDEVHAFIAPKLIGGVRAPSPVGGHGIEKMSDALRLKNVQVETIGDDIYCRGWL